jgi:hypothetical protein
MCYVLRQGVGYVFRQGVVWTMALEMGPWVHGKLGNCLGCVCGESCLGGFDWPAGRTALMMGKETGWVVSVACRIPFKGPVVSVAAGGRGGSAGGFFGHPGLSSTPPVSAVLDNTDDTTMVFFALLPRLSVG